MKLDGQHQSSWLLSSSTHASELSYFKTISLLLFICLLFLSCLLQSWKLGVFSDYKSNIFPLRKFKTTEFLQFFSISNENNTTHEDRYDHWKSTDQTCTNQIVNIFLVICPAEGESVDSQDHLLPLEKNIHSRYKSKDLKASFVTYTFPVCLFFYLLCSA